MSEVYCFNPENDLALAQGSANYCAPPAASAIARDLSLLPVWYGSEKGVALTPLQVTDSWLQEERSLLGVKTQWEEWPRFHLLPGDTLSPWGWSPAMEKRMLRIGALPAQLPTATQLDAIRRLSHRSTGIRILKLLRSEATLCPLPELALELARIEEVRTFVEKHPYSVLKTPWSGSGRGIFWGRGEFNRSCEIWCTGALSKQGSVIAERAYDKTADWAMEFRSDGAGQVCFAGYSLFETDGKGTYKGNLLLPDAEIERRIRERVPDYPLQKLRERLETILSDMLGTIYRGYMGVDMLVWRDASGREQIHPCVELNLRTNMGIVSRLLYDRYVETGRRGFYFIRYCENSEALSVDCESLRREYPLEIYNGRIRSGYLGLTPLFTDTCYHAAIRIE